MVWSSCLRLAMCLTPAKAKTTSEPCRLSRRQAPGAAHDRAIRVPAATRDKRVGGGREAKQAIQACQHGGLLVAQPAATVTVKREEILEECKLGRRGGALYRGCMLHGPSPARVGAATGGLPFAAGRHEAGAGAGVAVLRELRQGREPPSSGQTDKGTPNPRIPAQGEGEGGVGWPERKEGQRGSAQLCSSVRVRQACRRRRAGWKARRSGRRDGVLSTALGAEGGEGFRAIQRRL